MADILPLETADFDVETLGSLELALTVEDPESIAALVRYPNGPQREAFGLTALRIGVLALGQARGQVDAGAVRAECDRMLGTMQAKLGEHASLMQQRMAGALHEYFNPQDGKFHERVERLVKRDGELEQMLRRQIGHDDSQLSKTLAGFVGEHSPLFKILKPSESEGLLAALRETFGKQLDGQRESVLKEFSLDNKSGALARLVAELTEKQGKFSANLQEKIDVVVKEFSLNEENSALSRLVRNVTAAQQTITKEFSLDNEQSGLSRLSKLLKSTDAAIHENLTLDKENSALSLLKRELEKILRDQSEKNLKFQEEVKLAINTIITKREADKLTTRHGLAFEQALFECLQDQMRHTNDLAEFTGNSTGLIKNCKKGDCVVELGPEHAAAGAKIVIEAKEVLGFDLRQARAEIEEGRKNRGAQIGLFVYSKKTAPEGFEPITRFGDDVFCIWDAEDAATDLILRLGLTVCRALCSRKRDEQAAEKVDFTAIDKAVLAIQKRYEDFDRIHKYAETIVNNGTEIQERARIFRKDLELQVERLAKQIGEIKQRTQHEAIAEAPA